VKQSGQRSKTALLRTHHHGPVRQEIEAKSDDSRSGKEATAPCRRPSGDGGYNGPVIPALPRRRFLAAGAAAALAACSRWESPAPEHGPIAAMFPGRIDDGGFIEAGYKGLMRVPEAVKGMQVSYVDGVPPEAEAMKDALRKLAATDAKMVIAFGGQASEAAQRVAWEFPEQRFTVIQGSLLRPNLAVYEVLQEQSAYLAGAAAGMLTKTNVVGHMSGLRVRPGLKARAAFAAGLASTNGRAKLLTSFSGSQDDAALAKRIALAQIAAGASRSATSATGSP
jgi:basic membrane protein A